MSRIPAPELIGDTLSASLYCMAEATLLVVGEAPGWPELVLLRPGGPLTVRYALPYLHREASIVPGLFASEYGAMLVGREAWDYALAHCNLHPRADLVGIGVDGQPAQVMLRELDFGRGVEVWAYASAADRLPLARLTACWVSSEAPPLPELLAAYLPRWSVPPGHKR